MEWNGRPMEETFGLLVDAGIFGDSFCDGERFVERRSWERFEVKLDRLRDDLKSKLEEVSLVEG